FSRDWSSYVCSSDLVEKVEEKLLHYEKVELALQEALDAARETGRRAEDTAQERARLIVEEAELRAQRIVQDAEQERYGVKQDLVKLTSRQNEIAARLRAFLMSEMEVLAQFQGDDPIGFIKLVAAQEKGVQEALPAPRPRLDTAGSARESTGSTSEAAPAPEVETPTPEPSEHHEEEPHVAAASAPES